MTAAAEILSELAERGVSVRADGDKLRLRPAEKLDTVLLERVREAKPEILAALRTRPATCAASCYEIEPGRWTHHPWDGCRARPQSQPNAVAQVEAPCWHCHGLKECRCIICWDALRDTAGECIICHRAGVTLALVQ